VLFGGLAVAALVHAPVGFFGATTGPAGRDSTAGTAASAAHGPAAVANPTTVVLQFLRSVWQNLTRVHHAERQLGQATVFRSVSGLHDRIGDEAHPGRPSVGRRRKFRYHARAAPL
jgi:putative drug exporter of the RND superfamily